ncbi:polymerase/histidinol phosphatase-like protein [Lipomyces japonicus]|uniref:polymerase/histidinol phosphatase-like protein n=1 Tax=Lipomyces japonicus TaxID=56871 RepID=UPI0034CD51F6
MHSHHSHSGEYVLHAKDNLDDIVNLAIERGFTTYCLTEHIPRNNDQDFYPEEKHLKVQDLFDNFEKFYHHARRLQKQHKTEITLLVGFESDYIRADFKQLIQQIRDKYAFDMFVGSIHHVKEVPIDFDITHWVEAMNRCGGTPRQLYATYFDDQYEMLKDLRPPVVGHFDLIRLFSIDDSEKPISQWPEVLERVNRNLDFIVSYGGLIELNSAAIRKGWKEPYPREDICKIIIEKGGRFALSDDSHGLAQIGLNFHKVLDQVIKLGINKLYYLDLDDGKTVVREENVADIILAPFWTQYREI